ncbi:MAG: hypothetical protein QGG71_21760 [Pirellulaceae bacterium]|jgi:hypothetical protein|nr:hypothetical protein [Pirellulaceae bacterium]
MTHLILCLLLGNSVLADDGPAAASKPAQGNTPKGQVEKISDVELPQIPNPFADADPFGAIAAKEQDDKKAGKTDSGGGDPFGDSAPDSDPFGQQTDAAGTAASSIGDDPFGQSAPRNPASPKRAVARPSRQRVQQANVQPTAWPFLSITVEESSESRQRIEGELAKQTKFDYLDTPLKDVIDEIALRHNIPIIISTRALEDFGIGTDTPVTISLNGISLRSALRLMLNELDLTYLIENEVLQITTPEEAEANLQSRLYSVSTLLPANGDGDYLVKLITKHVAPDSWDEVGGPGAISFVDHLETLAVTQTGDVLRQIDTLLASVAKLAEHRSR